MPELPEVETIRQQLLPKIKGKTIKDVVIKTAQLAQFKKQEIVGVKILDVQRRAKLLIIKLANNNNLIIHLKLTGRLLWNAPNGDIIFYLDKGRLVYTDFRKFGYLKLVKNLEEFFKDYGPEPLEKEFSLEKFKELLAKKPRQKIKPLLMDQNFLAGVGNIYAQEACFYAGILPTRQVASLNQGEIAKLYDSLKRVLVLAIKHKGSSVDAYLDIYGQPGKFVPLLKVYGQKVCQQCKSKIKKIQLAGRGTSFCPRCQK